MPHGCSRSMGEHMYHPRTKYKHQNYTETLGVMHIYDQHHKHMYSMFVCYESIYYISDGQWPLLLTWFNFNPSMDK